MKVILKKILNGNGWKNYNKILATNYTDLNLWQQQLDCAFRFIALQNLMVSRNSSTGDSINIKLNNTMLRSQDTGSVPAKCSCMEVYFIGLLGPAVTGHAPVQFSIRL